MIYTRHPLWNSSNARRQQRTKTVLRVQIRPTMTSGLYSVVSRDVSQSAPQAPRVETRPANETDFTPGGVADPDTEVEMRQWHRGVTN